MSNELAVVQPPAFLAVAGLTGLDAKYLVETVKKQCFKGAATDEQVDAFISIACEMKVNPLLPGMLYAYPISGGGIVPIMGPSGVYKKLVEHPEVDSWETEVFPDDVTKPPTHAVTKIYRKGRDKPLQYTALLSEWKIASNPNWNSRPRHMLALRSLKHCANQIIHGIPYDEDDRAIMAMQNVTGTGEENPAANGTPADAAVVPERPAPKERAKRGTAAAKEVVVNPCFGGANEVVVPTEEQKPAEQVKADPVAEVKPVEDINKAMEARQEKIAPKPEEKPAATQIRAFLQDNEKLSTTIKLETLAPVFMTVQGVRTPCIKGTVSGGFAGEIRSSFGVSSKDGKAVEIDPVFTVGKSVSAVLVGKKSTAPEGNPNYGKVLVWIDTCAAVQAEEVA